jgi:hypothetical protein
MDELRRLSRICGGDISAARQAKKAMKRSFNLSGRQWKKLKKRTQKKVRLIKKHQQERDAYAHSAD